MNELKIFNNPEFGEIRTLEENGTVLFCGSDVAKALGYKKPSDAVSTHCRYTAKRSTPHPQNPSKNIEMLFIPEGDIYRLAARSELPGANRFERWIFDEVLPTIRKHGAYLTPEAVEQVLADPDTIIRLATDLKAERAQRLALEVELDRNKEWYSIKRVAHLNRISYKALDWRRLKEASAGLGYTVRKIFDANYGEVNTYHQSAWEAVYPWCEL